MSWAALRRDRVGIAAAALTLLVILTALLAHPLVSVLGLSGPGTVDRSALNGFGLPTGPSGSHPLGVDASGRDVLARIIYGSRVPLEAAILAAAIAILIAAGLALLATFRRAAPVLWLACPLAAVPAVVLGFGASSACRVQGCAGGLIEPGLGTLVFALALAGIGWATPVIGARLRELEAGELIAAARLTGASRDRIIRRELLPNASGALLQCAGVLLVAGVALESALSFLGVGEQPATADWGAMIASAGHGLQSGGPAWWLLVFPGIALLITLLALARTAVWVHRGVVEVR